VEDMQKGDLSERLAQEEEPGVQKLPILLRVENPKDMCEKAGMILFSSNVRTYKGVANKFARRRPQYVKDTPDDIAGQDYADEIVEQKDGLECLAAEGSGAPLHVKVETKCEDEVECTRARDELHTCEW